MRADSTDGVWNSEDVACAQSFCHLGAPAALTVVETLGPPFRAGYGVGVLLKIYAHCIDGQADAANKRIADALGGEDEERG